jgi:hypothetical protein
MSKPIEEILTPKPEARPRIYAYAIADAAHHGQLKVGQTTRDVKRRVAEQLKTAAIQNFTIELDEAAERDDGSIFTDHEVRAALVKKGFNNTTLEWVRCTVADVATVLAELRTGQRLGGTHHETFGLRDEQLDAVNKTLDYYQSIWAEDANAAPRFLWNAKMRFGKTFTTYQLAKKLKTKRVLVLTFKPAVEDAWQTDLENHVDFDGWQYLSRSTGGDPTQIDRDRPVVYFGSFQDLLGRDAAGNIKPRNEWLHAVNWDLVVFDEYHFGAWRDTAKELFEGEDDAVAKKEAKLEYAGELDGVNEDLTVLSNAETEFLPITTRAYLYLSGTPFKALATGEFIEEQIFNWTYTDEQRAKGGVCSRAPCQAQPLCSALPQMRLLTYQMPDELLAIASGGEFDEFDLNAFFEAKGTGTQLSSSTRAMCKSGWTSFVAAMRTVGGVAENGHAAAVSVFRRAPVAVFAAFVLVFAQRGGLPGDGEFAGRAAQHLLVGLPGHHGGRRCCGYWAGGAAAGAQGHWQRVRHQDHHAVVRQADHGRDGGAVVGHPDAAQPEIARELFSGGVSGAVAVVHQKPQRRQPE